MSIFSVIGQERALGRLEQGLRSERVAHGYVFHGPAGVGKELCAREFAKIILCQDRQKVSREGEKFFDCCDKCNSCQEIEADVHPDYHLVYREQIQELVSASSDHKATGLAIDVIREKVNGPCQLTSSYGRGKVFVVREVHLATPAAQNALLKSLEEPPDGTVLILLADKIDPLLPTILSRSQLVMFGPLRQDFVLEKLSEAGCGQPEGGFWSRFCEGSVGRGLWLGKQGWYEAKVRLVERLGGLCEGDVVELADVLIGLGKAHGAGVRKSDSTISETVAKKQIYDFMLGVVSSFYRDVMLCNGGREVGAWINCDQESAVREGAKKVSMLGASRGVGLASRAEYLIGRNVNATLVFEDLFGDLAGMSCKTVVG